MKTKIRKILLSFMAFCGVGILTACGANKINTPEDAIIEAYGDKQFRISFDSANLENPISDIYYSAKNMPVLPTPYKVGYVFAGWYFDTNYIDQCIVEDGDLFWKMKNVTLYAKWNVEEIVNNGQYDIEFEAHIRPETINKGPIADRYEYYEFDEDILPYGTYIEKNVYGTYLRIQYDCRTRGPVLGGADVNEDNFSQQTYTISDPKNRISEELSIFDRTSTLQTIYYDISGLNLSDPITLYVEYYNWVDDIPDEQRKSASVSYEVEFNITRFIGFGASFVNTTSRLEDGIYTLPTHYTGLDKSPSILDMFNPVNSYIVASKGNYKLYKPMSAYNNDYGEIKPEQFPLRTTGYAKEFTSFLVDQNKIVTKEEEENLDGENYIPQLFRADYLNEVTVEFNHETGQYYYIIDLGKNLDKDVVFFGGSSGAMEQMFDFPFSYRRLTIDYKSMVRVADWSYETPSGNRYQFTKRVSMYLGSAKDFEKGNGDFDHFKENKSSIDYPNCFYTLDETGKPIVYTSRVSITPASRNSLSETRNSFQYFDMNFEVFGYNPLIDGTLYSRDLTFVTAGLGNFSNSFAHENINGKSLNIGDPVSLNDLYREKITKNTSNYTYKAYKVDENLNVDYNSEVKLERDFIFKENVAILYDIDFKSYHSSSLVILAEKQNPKITLIDNGWTLNTENTYTTEKRFNIGDPITIPNLQYIYYGKKYYTRDLKKYDEDEITRTDYTKVSFWNLSQGIYTHHLAFVSPDADTTMDNERIIAMIQMGNQFGEIIPYFVEFRGVAAGEFTITNNGEMILNGDLKYDANRRHKIKHEHLETLDIVEEKDLLKVPKKFDLTIKDEGIETKSEILFDTAVIYTKKIALKATNISDIWNLIKDENYAIIYFYYIDAYGDQVLYKAQYNFRIEGDGLSQYNIIKEGHAIFTNQWFDLENPILSDYNGRIVDRGQLKCKKKVGNHFISDIYESVSLGQNSYYNQVRFKQSGTYLLIFEFNLVSSKNHGLLFDYINPNNFDSGVSINISQLVEVYDKNTDVEITYVTDKAHPFDVNSPELFGFTLNDDEKYQYATKTFKADERVKSLSENAFLDNPDLLYRWSDSNNKKVEGPGRYMEGLSYKMQTLHVYLYASWDPGSVCHVNYDIYGEVTHLKDVLIGKIPGSYNDYYEVETALIMFSVPQGYKVFGWEADQNIFYEEVEESGSGAPQYVRTNFHKGDLKGRLQLNGETTLTAILKKPTAVMYEAADVNGNKLEFLNYLSPDYKMFINDKLTEGLERTKLDKVLNVKCSDLNLELKYWEVYDSVSESYIKCDLKTLVLLEQYSVNKVVKLRAIFG